ncbi:hypothetical protein [Phenylobacterium sp.]|uniref:hypothetical protein n=1 Tax=Phenylobacterium sp. TaxID=1871053 RepID=UPI003BAD6CFC
MVRTASSAAARNTRIAISDRLATINRRMGFRRFVCPTCHLSIIDILCNIRSFPICGND